MINIVETLQKFNKLKYNLHILFLGNEGFCLASNQARFDTRSFQSLHNTSSFKL